MTRVSVRALDGYLLGGFLHHSNDSSPNQAAIFATGGGVRAEVYHHFLSYLASNGIPVLAIDYRGIGESRPARLRGLVAGFEDWGEYDLGGAIEWMSKRFPDVPVTGIGHSIGSLMIGAAERANCFSQLVLICPHTGYHQDYEVPLRWGVQLCWGLLGTPLRRMLGYFPASKLGFGEDLPHRVGVQWEARGIPHFEVGLDGGDPLRGQRLLDRIRQLRLPALVLSTSDDPWATEVGVRRMLFVYENLLVVRRNINANPACRPIGHWGFFRRRESQTLWPLVLRFLTSTPMQP